MNKFIQSLLFGWLLAVSAMTVRAAIVGDEDHSLFGEPTDSPAAISLPSLDATNLVDAASVAAAATNEVTLAQQIEIVRAMKTDDPVAAARQFRILGDLFVQANRMDEAARSYWQATRINPVNAGYLHYFGFALLALGDHTNGLEVYLELLARYPDARKALFNVAAAYYGLEEYEQAHRQLSQYVATARVEDPKAFYNMGLILLESGRPNEAISWLVRAQKRIPTNPFIPAALVRVYREIGSDELADHTQGLSEDRFGKEAFDRLLGTPLLPAFLDR
jgi:tetratricopeptide (TPR) repeat protein